MRRSFFANPSAARKAPRLACFSSMCLFIAAVRMRARRKLFNRTPKGAGLSATGSALLAHVKRLRLVREDVLREATDLNQGRAGHLRIGRTCGVHRPAAGCSHTRR